MTGPAGPGRGGTASGAGVGAVCVLLASVLWGTTGTAATFAPSVGPLAIGAVAMGLGGLLQALVAAPRIRREAPLLRARRGTVLLGALSVGAYPLAFYSSMHLAGVAVGTVVSIGAAPLASALIERVVDGRRLTRRWTAGAALGLSGTVLLCAAEAAGAHSGAGGRSAAQTVLGVGLGLVAAVTYALYSWAAHRLISRGVGSGPAMGAVFGLGGLLLMPVLLATGAPLLDSGRTRRWGSTWRWCRCSPVTCCSAGGWRASRRAPRPRCRCWSPPSRPCWPSWSSVNGCRCSDGRASPWSSAAWRC